VFECWWAVLVVNDGLQPLVIWVGNSLLHYGHRGGSRGGGGMRGHHRRGSVWGKGGYSGCLVQEPEGLDLGSQGHNLLSELRDNVRGGLGGFGHS